MKSEKDRSNAVFSEIPAVSYVADFERCEDIAQLQTVMETINRNGYQLVSVTQDSKDVFTVFFRRLVWCEGGGAY